MIVFATLGDTMRYGNALNLIRAEAIRMNLFDLILINSQNSLDMDWVNEHKAFILQNPRGFGYWIWKPQIVKQAFEKMNDGDILVYADSGCRLNVEGRKRLQEYIEMVKEHPSGNLSFELSDDCKEKWWNKGKVLNMFPIDKESNQLVGGIFVIRKCKFTQDLVNEWQEICNTYSNIDDSPSTDNDPEFKEHRHDQAVWSVLRKHRGTLSIKDETYFTDWSKNLDKPIHALRRK